MSSSDMPAPGANVRKFSFGEDLGRPAQERRAAAEQADVAQRTAIEEAERRAFARGHAAGRQEAEGETNQRLSETSQQIAAGIAMMLGDLDRREAEIETDALAFFDVMARKVAGRAIAGQPLAMIEDAAREAFRHLRGVPHLAVRVHESLVESVDVLLKTLARQNGFEGRTIVMGTDDIEPGDARLDWADGGVSVSRDDLNAAADAVMAHLLSPTTPNESETNP